MLLLVDHFASRKQRRGGVSQAFRHSEKKTDTPALAATTTAAASHEKMGCTISRTEDSLHALRFITLTPEQEQLCQESLRQQFVGMDVRLHVCTTCGRAESDLFMAMQHVWLRHLSHPCSSIGADGETVLSRASIEAFHRAEGLGLTINQGVLCMVKGQATHGIDIPSGGEDEFAHGRRMFLCSGMHPNGFMRCSYVSNRFWHARMHHKRIHQDGGRGMPSKRKFKSTVNDEVAAAAAAAAAAPPAPAVAAVAQKGNGGSSSSGRSMRKRASQPSKGSRHEESEKDEAVDVPAKKRRRVSSASAAASARQLVLTRNKSAPSASAAAAVVVPPKSCIYFGEWNDGCDVINAYMQEQQQQGRMARIVADMKRQPDTPLSQEGTVADAAAHSEEQAITCEATFDMEEDQNEGLGVLLSHPSGEDTGEDWMGDINAYSWD